eukprot:747534-Hanusia_phi.AAC.3
MVRETKSNEEARGAEQVEVGKAPGNHHTGDVERVEGQAVISVGHPECFSVVIGDHTGDSTCMSFNGHTSLLGEGSASSLDISHGVPAMACQQARGACSSIRPNLVGIGELLVCCNGVGMHESA